MKQQSYNYAIYLFGSEEFPIEVSQQQGEKLMIILMSSDIPKFVLIDDNIINVSAIKEIEKYELWDNPESSDKKPIMKKLSLSEIEIHNRYLRMKEELSGLKGVKLLNE